MVSVKGYIYQDIIDYYKDTDPADVSYVHAFYAWMDQNKTFGKFLSPILGVMYSYIFEDETINNLKTENPMAYNGYNVLLRDEFISDEGVFVIYKV